MKTLLTIVIIILSIPMSLFSETMDINISNPRVEADSFKFEIQVRRTDAWDVGFNKLGGAGAWDFYFNYNAAAFTGNPALSDTNAGLTTSPGNYTTLVQINGGKLQVKITWNQLDFPWNPTLDVYEDVCTVRWEIGNPSLNSGVTWDQLNTGFFDGDNDPITPTYFGSGDIPLPVRLTFFNSTVENSRVVLNWATESEINNLGFEVWRSGDEDGQYNKLSSYDDNPELAGQGSTSIRHEYSYTDDLVVNGQTYYYRLYDVDYNGVRTEHGPVTVTVNLSGLAAVSGDIPDNYDLHPNYPNPFNPSTTLRFDIPYLRNGIINGKLIIYNSLGQKVKELYSGKMSAGTFELKWDGTSERNTNAPSGIYFARLVTGDYVKTIKMMLIR